MSANADRFHRRATILLVCCTLTAHAHGFAGGTGEPNDPYLIATEEHLASIGSDPALLDKYFELVDNISLNSNLPYRSALIAPDTHTAEGFQGSTFTGRLDGQNRMIQGLAIQGGTGDHLGLFGKIGPGGRVYNVRLMGSSVTGGLGSRCLGALAGCVEGGLITRCSASGYVGGGGNAESLGGLVGFLWRGGRIIQCSASGTVSGGANCQYVGALVGSNGGDIINCYATGGVSGGSDSRCLGGLVGHNGAGIDKPPFLNAAGHIIHCYATATASGGTGSMDIGGLVGANYYSYTVGSFWDIQRSGALSSAGGKGLKTTRMYDRNTYLAAGWDLAGERANGTADVWQAGGGYPMLSSSASAYLNGSGTPHDPFSITTAEELGAANYYDRLACYKLDDNIDLAGITWAIAPLYSFDDRFDGGGYVISNLRIRGRRYLGLFDVLGPNGRVKNLTVKDAEVVGEAGSEYVATMVGCNRGLFTACEVIGKVNGNDGVAGFAGCNSKQGRIDRCRTAGTVEAVGGTLYLAGGFAAINRGTISDSRAHVQVTGTPHTLGGLVGSNRGTVCGCYADGQATGDRCVGGMIGSNGGKVHASYATVDIVSRGMAPHAGSLAGTNRGILVNCYAVGSILNECGDSSCVGGLVGGIPGGSEAGAVVNCFWNTDVSGIHASEGGTPLTTEEMMDVQVYSRNGWGDDPNWMLNPGADFPRLTWEGAGGGPIPVAVIDWFEGSGTHDDPYILVTGEQLALVGTASILWDKTFALTCDVVLTGDDFPRIGVCRGTDFIGTFDGGGHVVSNLVIDASRAPAASPLGLFGYVAPQGCIRDLVLQGATIQCGRGSFNVGILAGVNEGAVTACFTTGRVLGGDCCECLGGLIGLNRGVVTDCDSTAGVSAGSRSAHIGPLTGYNAGYITRIDEDEQ